MGRREGKKTWMRGGSTVGRHSKGAGAYVPTRPESLLGNCMETKHAKTATLSLTLLGGKGGRGKQQIELRQPNSSRRKGKGHG